MMLIYRQATSVLYGPGGMVPNARPDQQQAAGLLRRPDAPQAAGVPSASAGSQLLLPRALRSGREAWCRARPRPFQALAAARRLPAETRCSGKPIPAATASGPNARAVGGSVQQDAVPARLALAARPGFAVERGDAAAKPAGGASGVSQVAPVLSVPRGSCWSPGAAPIPDDRRGGSQRAGRGAADLSCSAASRQPGGHPCLPNS